MNLRELKSVQINTTKMEEHDQRIKEATVKSTQFGIARFVLCVY